MGLGGDQCGLESKENIVLRGVVQKVVKRLLLLALVVAAWSLERVN
jgi:hypothetical protein